MRRINQLLIWQIALLNIDFGFSVYLHFIVGDRLGEEYKGVTDGIISDILPTDNGYKVLTFDNHNEPHNVSIYDNEVINVLPPGQPPIVGMTKMLEAI